MPVASGVFETDSCERVYGFKAGERLRYTKGSLKGTTTVVAGVRDGKLWSIDDGQNEATFFCGIGNEGLLGAYGLVNEEEYQHQLASDREQLEASVAFIDTLLTTGSVVSVDASPHVCSKFGFKSGDELVYTKGALRGRKTVVIGVYDGRLWSRDEGSTGASFFLGRTKSGIQKEHGLVTPGTPPQPPSQSPTCKCLRRSKKKILAQRQKLMLQFGLSPEQVEAQVPLPL